ncbi:MAG: hypothetical protein O7H41_03335 [Planctomycetota bacterium]|nr:hypothetical protein [Planctomycetota bacterium]
MVARWKPAAFGLILLLTGGCTYSRGHLDRYSNVSVVLSERNFSVVKTSVLGQSTGFKVFGIGPSPSYAEAVDMLKESAEIDGGPRALVNITVDTKWRGFFPFYWRKVLIVTADVVEFFDKS